MQALPVSHCNGFIGFPVNDEPWNLERTRRMHEVERPIAVAFEIVQVANDPDHLERGRILFDIRGGRQ